MSSYILRFLKSSIPSKRLVSQLTQRGEGKLGALLRQLGLQKMLGVFELGSKEGTGKRGLSTTAPMAQKRKFSWLLLLLALCTLLLPQR